MRVLVTGNRGYIGSVLVQLLIEKSFDVIGYDIDFYSDNYLTPYNPEFLQIYKDTRDCSIEDLKSIDAIIHLAALSNDPLGELSPHLTRDINYSATMKIARLAKEAGVKRFIYASSQSMYGISKTDNELDEDDSEKNPVTEYAKTKWDAEIELKKMSSPDFIVTSFRPSTVFGASPKLRTDIVFNNLVACAYTTGKIEILSDGTPWRPVVHIKDVCQAFIAGLEAPAELIGGRAFNVGIKNGNYTVRDLAEAAQKAVPGCELIFLNQHTDPRSYKISFNRIFNELNEYYKPEWNLEKGGYELVEFFRKTNFTENDFRGRKCTRLKQINYLMLNNEIDNNLRKIK